MAVALHISAIDWIGSALHRIYLGMMSNVSLERRTATKGGGCQNARANGYCMTSRRECPAVEATYLVCQECKNISLGKDCSTFTHGNSTYKSPQDVTHPILAILGNISYPKAEW